jgi:hypothetical protein
MPQHINNLLRLEVDASDASNSVTNHSGDGGTTGWFSTGGSGALVVSTQFEGGNSLRVGDDRSPTTTQRKTGISSNNIATSPDIWVNFQVQTVGTLYNEDVRAGFSMTVTFLDSASNVLSTVQRNQTMTYPDSGSWATQKFGAPVKAPAGAAFYRVSLGLQTPSPWTSSYNMLLFSRRWMVVSSPTQALVGDVPFTTEPAWQNFLGKSYSLTIDRGLDLNGVVDSPQVGLLSAVIGDPLFDPATNPRMRPTRQIRVTEKGPNSSQWVPIYTGRIATLDTNYASGKPRISLTATDLFADLAKIPAPVAYSGTFKQRVTAALAGTGIPFNVVDPATNTTSAVINTEDNATVLDQLQMACNTMRGYMYVDGAGVLQLRAQGQLQAASPASATFSDTKSDQFAIYYHDLDVNFGSQALTNTLMIERSNVDEVEDNGKKVYGPYVNSTSVANWGTISSTLQVNDGTPSALAQAYLSVYANPTIFCKSLTFNAFVRRADGYEQAFTYLDRSGILYDPVSVKFGPAGLNQTYRVIGVKHEITPDDWDVTLVFKPVEATSAATVTNPPAGANTGPSDVTPPEPGIIGFRRRTAAFGMTNNTNVTIPFDTAGPSQYGITWDTTNNRFVIPRDGRYHVSAAVRWVPNGNGWRVIQIGINGVASPINDLNNGSQFIVNKINGSLYLRAGDVVSVIGFQNSGATLNIEGDNFFTIAFLGQ